MVHTITHRVDKGASLPAIFEQFVSSAFVLSVLQQVIAWWCYRDIVQQSRKPLIAVRCQSWLVPFNQANRRRLTQQGVANPSGPPHPSVRTGPAVECGEE